MGDKDTVMLRGKYLGFTFEEVMERDLPYCEFIYSLKFVKEDFKDFQNWLKIHIKDARKKKLDGTMERIQKSMNM